MRAYEPLGVLSKWSPSLLGDLQPLRKGSPMSWAFALSRSFKGHCDTVMTALPDSAYDRGRRGHHPGSLPYLYRYRGKLQIANTLPETSVGAVIVIQLL